MLLIMCHQFFLQRDSGSSRAGAKGVFFMGVFHGCFSWVSFMVITQIYANVSPQSYEAGLGTQFFFAYF